jgi:LmbE family N-acetylglucosaminyl deacetylase
MTRLRSNTAEAVVSLDGFDRLVVVAPHPDDEVLACGLLLAHAATCRLDTIVIAVTDGEAAYPDHDPEILAAVRRREQAEALAELGVGPELIDRVGVPDGSVADHVEHLATVIGGHLTPDVTTLLIAPSIHDWHPDHEACGRAALLARRRSHRSIPQWSSLFWAHHHPERLLASRPEFVRVTGSCELVDARRRAVARHRSQFATPTAAAPILDEALISHLDEPVELYVREPS